ncbi:MAG TPA: polyphosphate kinase 1 [Actinomycetota bacterium]|jgi:polyphosphate kinase|nr:polyphosphate kinase 1 [Actinomycetota bacterium]
MTDLDVTGIEVAAAPHLAGEERFLNRELSWLDFSARVLALAQEAKTPLLERAKFLAIFSTILDEFFQIRVAGLKEQLRAGLSSPGPDGMSPREQLDAIRARTVELTALQGRTFLDDIVPALEKERIVFVTWDEVTRHERADLSELFDRQIFPVLTPLAVDPAHPFPYVSNLSLNLAVMVSDPTSTGPRFARVKVPSSLPRFVQLPDGERFLPLEELIGARLDVLFPGMEIKARYPFRVTRNADLEVEEDEADDLLAAIEVGLRHRRRSPHAVRLEIGMDMSNQVRELLVDELELDAQDIYVHECALDLGGLFAIYSLTRPELKDEPWTPTTQPRLAIPSRARRDFRRDVGDVALDPWALHPFKSEDEDAPNIFDVIRRADVLVQHPYDSFDTSVQSFIAQAAVDPHVLAIKWTLYRTSGPESPIIRNLIRASHAGKQVVALVELKAQFDEAANIAWARALEEAGVHVVYGLVGLKTHAKIALVVRQEGDVIVRYTHVGTGNYNPSTATMYEDIGVLSADPDVGADVSDLFNFLTGYSRQRAFRKLLVAPLGQREQLLDLIHQQASRPNGCIVMKMNSLVDPQMIDALYSASQSGVEIDLIVRGVCCLRPGVRGLSETIRVRSILGRYLEHSRMFRFGDPGDGAEYYIGSADLMSRNLDRRVEVLLPVADRPLRERLDQIIRVDLEDDTLAWTLDADGTWTKVKTINGHNSQRALRDLANERSKSSA